MRPLLAQSGRYLLQVWFERKAGGKIKALTFKTLDPLFSLMHRYTAAAQ